MRKPCVCGRPSTARYYKRVRCCGACLVYDGSFHSHWCNLRELDRRTAQNHDSPEQLP